MQNASDVHTFKILENGKPVEAEFHFDRMTTKKEAKYIVTQVEGHKLAKH